MIPAVSTISIALLDGAPGQSLPREWRTSVLSRLLENGFPVRIIRDLSNIGKDILALGWMDAGVSGTAAENVQDVAGLAPEAVLELVSQRASGSATPGKRWKPWFPVIDYQRCTNCMQCLSFCLFDVYGVTQDGRIQVQKESNCKTDCPACSRVCPEVAIMFPKYKAGPINGDEVHADDIRREAMKVDISALLGGDIYSMLRDRSAKAKSRFSLERDDERALKERQRCLDKLKRDGSAMEIPAEVLASLPSAEEIQVKAEQARQRAADALALQAARAAGPATESR
ncbi:MAG TPA: ferredoxin family protein [Planctomycetaceae bacterium]|nr:ferredoxin family protein [Planctomycetaceae bacterium]